MPVVCAFATLLLACIATFPASAEPMSAANFHSKVVELYSFEPHTLSNAAMQAKSDQLDLFWAIAKGDPSNTVPLLRSELENPSNSAFFSYDGSKLLLALSSDRSDQGLALRSIAKADLRGVQHTDYLRTVHWFASKGFDTREAALRVLAFPDFKAFIPQHSLMLGQDDSLIYMLFPMEETLFVSDLSARLATESNVHTQKSLLLALWYAATPAGNAAVVAFAGNQKNDLEAMTYAKSLMERTAGLGTSSPSSTQSIREERRRVMQRPISDEALIEFDTLTMRLITTQ